MKSLARWCKSARDDLADIFVQCDEAGLSNVHEVARLNTSGTITISRGKKQLYSENAITLRRIWSETTYQLQKLRDNPACAQQEYDRTLDAKDAGLHAKLTYDLNENIAPALLKYRPKIAILREQGVNGQVEMAAAFDRAGFAAVDVHMSDIISGRVKLADFKGVAACGGFSYGDVLGAGEGWAKSILFNPRARDEFEAFFKRSDTFALGRVQRLPDDEQPARDHPRCGKLGALCAQPVGTIRGALRHGGSAAIALHPVRRHGRQPHAHRCRRTAKVMPISATARSRKLHWSRCAMSITTAKRRRPIRSIPTARRKASPASLRRTGASAS